MASTGASGVAVLLGRLLLARNKGTGLAHTAAGGRFQIRRDCESQWLLCGFKILSELIIMRSIGFSNSDIKALLTNLQEDVIKIIFKVTVMLPFGSVRV